MHAYEVGHAEPREQIESPSYRANFWTRPKPGYAFNLDAWVLVGASGVEEALQWVSDHRAGRDFELFAEVEEMPVEGDLQVRNVSLVRLAGDDPNSTE